MSSYRLRILIFLFLCPALVMAQSREFELRSFHENITDLTAAHSNIRDLNGRAPALIRFAVRDTLFDFDPNLGYLRLEKKVGEVWLYVPKGTKRITIRHPYLGVLRDEPFPVPIMPKVTYDAEIVITNEAYLVALMSGLTTPQVVTNTEVAPPVVDTPPAQDSTTIVEVLPVIEVPPVIETPPVVENTNPSMYIEETPKSSNIGVHFMAGVGYNLFGMQGLSFSAALEIGKLYLGADYVIGSKKVEGIAIYTGSGSARELLEAYDYSASRFNVRLGINPSPKTSVLVIPQAGFSVNLIKGHELMNNVGDKAQFSESCPMSVFAALRLQVRTSDNFCFYLTPQYDILVAPDDVYKELKVVDNTFKSWAEGFSVNATAVLRF